MTTKQAEQNFRFAASIAWAVVLFAMSCASWAGPATRGADSRPNIVLFIADDMSWHDCGAYGGTDVRTPNVDRLAGESMKFDSAFAASPTCTPSRSAIYSGLYPFRNGAHANHSLVKDGLTTLPAYLNKMGYRVAIAGKTHIAPRAVFPFEYLKDSNVMPPGKHHALWTDLNTAAIEELLRTHDQSQPLCLIVCAHSPHTIWMENDGYDPAALKLPPYFLDTPETRAARCRYYSDVSWMDKQLGEVRASLEKHGYSQNTLFMFTSDQGAQWPFAKWNLYDAGIRVPLLIHWPSKAVAPATTSAMVSLIDLLPTMIEAAGGDVPADLDGKSFLPVVLGRSQQHREEVFASHTGDKEMNRAPMRCVRTDRYKYILNLAPQIPYTTHINHPKGDSEYWQSWAQLAKKDERAATLVERYERRPAEELYDVQADPFELKNLAEDEGHHEVLSQLREKVKQWRVQQGEDLKKVPMPEDARMGENRYAG